MDKVRTSYSYMTDANLAIFVPHIYERLMANKIPSNPLLAFSAVNIASIKFGQALLKAHGVNSTTNIALKNLERETVIEVLSATATYINQKYAGQLEMLEKSGFVVAGGKTPEPKVKTVEGLAAHQSGQSNAILLNWIGRRHTICLKWSDNPMLPVDKWCGMAVVGADDFIVYGLERGTEYYFCATVVDKENSTLQEYVYSDVVKYICQ